VVVWLASFQNSIWARGKQETVGLLKELISQAGVGKDGAVRLEILPKFADDPRLEGDHPLYKKGIEPPDSDGAKQSVVGT